MRTRRVQDKAWILDLHFHFGSIAGGHGQQRRCFGGPGTAKKHGARI